MSWLDLQEITEMVQGDLEGANIAVEGVGIDSRTIKRGELFVAIEGEHFDGHDFVTAAAAAGATAVMISKPIATTLAQVRVSDTLQALARLAAQWRRRLKIVVLALTGSNGKTTTKEMIATVLGRCLQVIATRGNFNNHIGVPLTLLAMRERHDIAVVEMGANHQGEIRSLCSIAKPDIALLLNAATAHIDGFGSLDGVAEAKGEIFQCLSESGTAILNKDDAYYEYWKRLIKGQQTVEFSLANNPDAEFRLLSNQGQTAEFYLAGEIRTCRMRLLGRHNIANALAAAAASYAVGIGSDDIVSGIESVFPVTGRLELHRGINGSQLIDDSYNANPASLEAALSVLKEAIGERWLALGVMAELGNESAALHAHAGIQAKAMGVDRLFTVGGDADIAAKNFGAGGESFDSVDTLIACLKTQLKPDVSLLIKGSRAAKMDRLVAALAAANEYAC